jgi:hypothetical protein
VLFSHGDGLARLWLSNHHACGSSSCTIFVSSLTLPYLKRSQKPTVLQSSDATEYILLFPPY